MPKKWLIFFTVINLTLFSLAYAEQGVTHRISQLSNKKVSVWETTIYPSKKQVLRMHRHDNDRVLIALTDGTLKVMNDKGQSYLLTLKKNKAYYLKKDVANELHSDENMSNHPIKVLIVDLKQ